jgi:hypothetical protein
MAGVAGTIVMTVIMYALPLVGLPRMDIMAALGGVFPASLSPYVLGGMIHLFNGIVLALIFAAFCYGWLPGPKWVRGALFSLAPWLFAITLLGPSLQLAATVLGAGAPTSNPCAVPNPCTPAAYGNPCAPANPCAVGNPCAPAVAANPCAPAAANPCAAKPVNPCAPVTTTAQTAVPPQALSLIVHLIYGGVVGALYRPRS